jgi:hypothetical protein
MKIFSALLALVLICFIGLPSLADETESEYIQVAFNLGLIHGFSISDLVKQANPGKKILHSGISLASFSSGADKLNGISLSGFWSGYTEEVNGVQLSGFVNTAGGNVKGIQLAGFTNINSSTVLGIQLAGFLNSSSGEANALQASGFVNFVGGKGKGLFMAGFANFLAQESEAALFSGLANLTTGTAKGFFMAGFVNLAFGNVEAAQISGFANIAGSLKGAQIGVFNWAEELDGFQIGLVSYVKSVGLRQEIWYDDLRFAHIGLRSGGRQVYNLISVGVRTNELTRYALGWAIGKYLSFELFNLEIDLSHYSIVNTELVKYWERRESGITSLRILGLFAITDSLSLFAGVTLNLFMSRRDDGEELIPWAISSSRSNNGVWTKLWPGFLAGIRF